MDIDDYMKTISQLAHNYHRGFLDVLEFLEDFGRREPKLFEELINIRKELLTNKDKNSVSWLLKVGYFKDLPEEGRFACFNIAIELERSISMIHIKQSCEEYHKSQVLFKKIPEIFNKIRKNEKGNKDYELIDIQDFESVNDSEIVKFRGKYSLISGFLNPAIVWWAKSNFPESPLYIRLTHHLAYTTCPPQRMYEAILIPANPNWWKNIAIHKNSKLGASYFLEQCESKDNFHQFWEYKVKGLRKLEVFAKRNTNGNLSMMLEEISEREKNNGYIIGKCIHLDTDDPYGTNFEDSILKHLDLSINVYMDEKIQKRNAENLAHGMVENASIRTHLFRIEKIPFPALISFVLMFFDSTVLKKDWLEDQFK